ncbi:DHA2 family efflux MFS transporter permease subunit [Microbacterium kribbense]|uniref:DHA2 family efflux MFS transporter permease subunit n=1 Tax=Microbacterium kribbense TaxID=433645 RepID=A0ABP7G0Q2_9MICO
MSADRRRWIGLVSISLAVALIIVDSTIVNVAIPSIVDDLGITSTQVQWVQESYTLVFAALLLVFGTLADRWGRRRMLLIGVGVFTVASVLAALSPTGDLLIASRVLQGVGGAMVLPTTLSLINATFRGRERGIAFAVWGSTIGGMVAVGPLLGGWLTTAFSWRWAFGINIPLGLIIAIGILLTTRESTDSREAGIDIGGAVLSILASAALVFGLIEGRTYGWWLAEAAHIPSVLGGTWPLSISPIPLVFVLAAAATAALIWRGRRRTRAGRTSMLPFDLLAIASFRNGNVAAMIVSLGEFGIILALPLWLQNVLGYSALQTGVVLLALALGSFAASGLSAAVIRSTRPVTIVRAGIAAEIVGVVSLGVIIAPHTAWWAIVPCLFVYGIGVGLATAQLTGVVLQDVPVDSSGQGSGTASTARQIGSALGIAILGTILFSSTGAVLSSSLAQTSAALPETVRSQIVDAVVTSAGGAIPGLVEKDAAVGGEARQAFSDGTRYAAFTAAGFLTLGLAATFRLSSPAPSAPSAPQTPVEQTAAHEAGSGDPRRRDLRQTARRGTV